ncbi:MAG TPA: hypothetical protein VML96_03570 [Egibacteraceae bacterium]|nr:hypothetical protein [Egibacteraceae bacterium]
MRILFTFAGGFGHAAPLIPIARAVQDVGHEVAFTGRASLMPTLEAHGFATFAPSGSDADGPPQRTPLRAVSIEREERVLREDSTVIHGASR